MDYQKFVNDLRELGLTVFTAESCTGGLIAKKITDIPGSSEVLMGGIVSYTNNIKMKLLGVKEESISEHTEVSAEVAKEMALGAAKYADIGISVTGYASPWKDCETGLVYIGIAFNGFSAAYENHFSGSRDEIRNLACDTACQIVSTLLGGIIG